MDLRMLQYQGLLYSLVDEMTPGKLKAGEYPRDVDTSKLEKWMEKHQIACHVQGEDAYHMKFLSLTSPPYMYYFQGDHDVLCRPLLGIVGPRKMTSYAQEVLESLFARLQGFEIATISGMAEGVDTLCHDLSMHYNIPTVAVLGAGLGFFLQSKRRNLMEKIVDAGGLVLSEFPLKMKPQMWSFPQRNRLIAGLGQCLFLPEAGEESGSLITVEAGVKMKRAVYGTPASMFCVNSQGLLRCMQEGSVKVVVDMEKFLEEEFGGQKLRSNVECRTSNVELTEEQRMIVEVMREFGEGVSVDVLVGKVELRMDAVMAELTILEMQGVVKEERVGVYGLR